MQKKIPRGNEMLPRAHEHEIGIFFCMSLLGLRNFQKRV